MNRRGFEDKSKNVKPYEKGKEKFEEIRDQMKKTWVTNNDSYAMNGSTPNLGARISFSN